MDRDLRSFLPRKEGAQRRTGRYGEDSLGCNLLAF